MLRDDATRKVCRRDRSQSQAAIKGSARVFGDRVAELSFLSLNPAGERRLPSRKGNFLLAGIEMGPRHGSLPAHSQNLQPAR